MPMVQAVTVENAMIASAIASAITLATSQQLASWLTLLCAVVLVCLLLAKETVAVPRDAGESALSRRLDLAIRPLLLVFALYALVRLVAALS
jgi:hypothetical protein